ncbi:MAG TPA: hypothetical protein VHW95_06385 [Steroidobacteraceae bacterium]|jgi:hypothetical protein|nr:hypothetical protein [Steroidobacteraceae bacterium]
MALLLLDIGIALGACCTPPPLDQAIKCDQFKRSPDGSSTTTSEVSRLREEWNSLAGDFSEGVIISASRGGQDAAIVAAIEKRNVARPNRTSANPDRRRLIAQTCPVKGAERQR